MPRSTEAALRRWPWLARLLDRAWDRYDDLGDWQRAGLGLAVALVLGASALYCLGVASLIALSRHPPSAIAETPLTPVVPPGVATVATREIEPISPLLADRTPTLRPTSTRSPTTTFGPSPTPSPRATATESPRPAAGAAQATPSRTPTRTPTRTVTATRAVR